MHWPFCKSTLSCKKAAFDETVTKDLYYRHKVNFMDNEHLGKSHAKVIQNLFWYWANALASYNLNLHIYSVKALAMYHPYNEWWKYMHRLFHNAISTSAANKRFDLGKELEAQRLLTSILAKPDKLVDHFWLSVSFLCLKGDWIWLNLQ